VTVPHFCLCIAVESEWRIVPPGFPSPHQSTGASALFLCTIFLLDPKNDFSFANIPISFCWPLTSSFFSCAGQTRSFLRADEERVFNFPPPQGRSGFVVRFFTFDFETRMLVPDVIKKIVPLSPARPCAMTHLTDSVLFFLLSGFFTTL